MFRNFRAALTLAFLFFMAVGPLQADESRLSVLFLGDEGHHQPEARAIQLTPVMANRGIDITYTDNIAELNPTTLKKYDGLIIFANTVRIEPREEKALLDYVQAGGGFIPLHCASYCFLNSPKYIELVGAQFQRHGTGTFRTRVVDAKHPITAGLSDFETWDETYVHTKHNSNRHVLQVRREGNTDEPWTWTRTHGDGRVFYTAYGHDDRTWSNTGFHDLVERGIRWATKSPQVKRSLRPTVVDAQPFQYVAAKLPNYLAGKSWGTQGAPNSKMQLPVSPAESMKHLVTPAEFRIELFAAEPDIAKPITMAWDAGGRLWIAETIDYPNELQPEGKGRDRIKICEDTDGDGKADKFTVFADKLSIPTSLTFARGGVIVHQAPHTLFLKDTDGDDKADVREILFTGWSTSDTHAGPSNLRYGHDNWIWGIVGYSGFRGTVGGEQHRFSTGFYRFKPDGSKIEFVRNTDNNSWGIGFTEEGIVFGSTANRNPSVYMPIANRYYEAVRGWSSRRLGATASNALFYPITDKIRQVDQHGQFTAAAGHAIYTARDFPSIYWNRTAFVNGPTGHLTSTFTLHPRGTDFVTHNSWNLLASDDEWTAPIFADVGPDGAVWAIDWYNYIIQHNPTPRGYKTGKGNAYMTDLRDKRHGRIYRIIYRQAKDKKQPQLVGASPQELVATLRNDNMFWRMRAQRLLVERGKLDVVDALITLAKDTSVDSLGVNPGAIHALWTLDGLGAMDSIDGAARIATTIATTSLKHPSAGVRRAAVMVLPDDDDSAGAILSAGSLADDDAQVRLAAALALSEKPSSEAVARAVSRAIGDTDNMADRWLPDALTSAAAAHAVPFLESLVGIPADYEVSKRQADIVARVAEHHVRGGAVDSVGALMVAAANAQTPVADAIIAGIAKGWPKGQQAKLDDASEKAMVALLEVLSFEHKSELVRLAGLWGTRSFDRYAAEIAIGYRTVVEDSSKADSARAGAARQLVAMQPTKAAVAEAIVAQLGPQTSPELAQQMLAALADSQSDRVATAVIEAYNGMTPVAQKQALSLMTKRSTWTRILLDAAQRGEIGLALLALDQKQALFSHRDKQIAALATKVLSATGGLPSPDRKKVLEQLLPLARRSGSVAHGKEMFTKHCAKCHTYKGEGAQIGPDLTGMAVHPKAELLTQILDPNRSVEGNYQQYSVVTTEGRILIGLLASENRTAIELFDAEGKKQIVLREDIEELIASNKSLMPEGFEKQMNASELVDLLEFLAQRGKYIPLSIGKVATVVTTKGMFFNPESRVERLVFADWKPKTFLGIPFQLVDPQGDRTANAIMLYGPQGVTPPKMPKSVNIACNSNATAIHFLSGVAGWAAQSPLENGSVSMIVRLRYADGTTEDHPLRNGEHFADYIGIFEVPKSKLAFKLRGKQMRYLSVVPKRQEVIGSIELVKGRDGTAPIVMAITIETGK